MQKDKGLRLLEILKLQRQAFIRRVDGKKLITDHLLYHQMEDEGYRLQVLIGLENKRKIVKELNCKPQEIYKHIHKEIR